MTRRVPGQTLSNIKDLQVWFDRGISDLHVFNKGSSGRFGVTTDSPLMYWMDSGKGKDTVELSEFVGPSARLDFLRPPDPIEFFLYALQFGTNGTRTAFQNRTLHIRSGAHEESVDFERSSGMFSNEQVRCKELSTYEPLEAGKAEIRTSSAVAGVLVKIDRGPTSSYSTKDSELQATNGNGWITISGLRAKALLQAKSGWVSFAQFSGNVVNIRVGEVQISPSPVGIYTAIGDFKASYEKGGQLRFLGTAKALFRDGNRMNPTKWETFTWDQCAFLLTIGGSLLAALAKFTTDRLKKNSPSSWLSH